LRRTFAKLLADGFEDSGPEPNSVLVQTATEIARHFAEATADHDPRFFGHGGGQDALTSAIQVLAIGASGMIESRG
jgi:hypothetical protein